MSTLYHKLFFFLIKASKPANLVRQLLHVSQVLRQSFPVLGFYPTSHIEHVTRSIPACSHKPVHCIWKFEIDFFESCQIRRGGVLHETQRQVVGFDFSVRAEVEFFRVQFHGTVNKIIHDGKSCSIGHYLAGFQVLQRSKMAIVLHVSGFGRDIQVHLIILFRDLYTQLA